MIAFLNRIVRNPALKFRDYRRLWVSSSFNSMGMTGEQVIVGFLVFELTGSTAWVGASLAFYFGPMLLFGVPAGAIADWIDRRKLLPMLEGAITVLLGMFGLFLFLGEVELWQLLLVTFISGSLRAIYNPIRASYIYDIVGGNHIVSSFGLLNLGARVGQLLGALLSGGILHYLDAGFAFLSLCAGHGIALLMLLRLTTVGKSAEAKPVSISENLREYWLELRHNRSLLALIGLTSTVEILGFSFVTALPEIATIKLEVGAEELGYMHAARACGGMLAGLVLAGALDLQHKGKVYLFVAFGFGLAVAALGVAPYLSLVLVAVAAVAAMAASTDILSQSMMQLVVPDRLRGRAMGTWVFAIGVAPIGHLEMGVLAVLVSADAALIINGIILLLIAAGVLVWSSSLAKL